MILLTYTGDKYMISARDLLQMIVAGVGIAMFAIFIARPYQVNGQSMEPTFSQGNLIIISRIMTPRATDVVVVQTQYGEMLKRIVKFDESGQIWVEGDNKEASTDSREYGWLPANSVVGKVIFKVW